MQVKRIFNFTLVLVSLFAAFDCALAQGLQGRARIDISNYKVEAELIPQEHLLRARGEVSFVPLSATRSVVFEFNGSLKVESIERGGKPLTNFVQDAVGTDAFGPSVRVDLGEVVPANQNVTLVFKWSGPLITPEGGPLPTKRLAYIGPEGSYLMYAARWFPFHDYAADRATAEITITVPTGFQVAGSSDEPVTQTPAGSLTRYRFVNRRPALVGNFAAARYITRTFRHGEYEIHFFVTPGNEARLDQFSENVGNVLRFYTQQYGRPDFGSRLVIAQIDDESLEAYAGPGMVFLSSRLLNSARSIAEEKIQREVAYQWWGQTVGLASFDDAWVSQGLAEWSAFAYRESMLSGGQLDSAQREQLERALTFEQSASISRAPSALDDQSAAYQSVMFFKGSMVFRMLRETLGSETFARLLRAFLEEYRGKRASVNDFEELTNRIAGRNMRYFFAQWVEGTGVPEFSSEYQIMRTRKGTFRARGTVRQNFESLRMPVEVQLRAEGDLTSTTLMMEGKSEDFDFETKGLPLEIIIDPNFKVLRISEELRIATLARRAIERFREGAYSEAQQQFEAALKLDRSNSWIYYNLGLLYFEQRNWNQALDNFQAALSGNLNPDWIRAWAHIKRGNVYDARGDRARAVHEYRAAIQSGIDFDNAQSVAKRYLATPYDPRQEQATVR